MRYACSNFDDDDTFIVSSSLKFVLRHINSICNITGNKTLRQENKVKKISTTQNQD